LPVNIHTESCNSLQAVGAVKFPCLLERLPLTVVQHRKNEAVAGLFAEGVLVHGFQLAAEASVRGHTRRQMQVASALLDELLHQVFDHHVHAGNLTDAELNSRDIPAKNPGVRHHIVDS